MKRASSFGFGKKYDFTKDSNQLNCNFYESPSEFNPKKPKSPAWTFGVSRDYYEKVRLI